MTELLIKECKQCNEVFYDNVEPVKLIPKESITLVYAKISKCHLCINKGERESFRR